MQKSFIDSIKVGNPCTEKWEEMTGNERVRFCSHCAKHVNNISEMTRTEAARLVRKSDGRLCVRYRTDPKTNSPVFAERVTSFARQTAAAGVLGASLVAAPAYSQNETPAQPLVQIERTLETGPTSSKISGYVTDPNGAAIPYALVSITNQETFLSHVQNATAEGFYEFKDLDAGKYKLRFEAGGFAFKEVEDVYIGDASETRRDGQLALNHLIELVQVGGEKADVEQYVTVGTIGIVMETHVNRNELVTAVLREDLDEVKARVIMRAKINAKDKAYDGMSPLHAAVETGNLEIAEYLLTHGATPNIRDSFKRTPLMMMNEDATPEMFQLLVRYGAKATLLDKQKNNLLHHLVENEQSPELIRMVANYVGNVNNANKERKTPLMIAVENGRTEVVKVLIESGADVNARDSEGRTALDMAGENLSQTRTLLETYGAVPGAR